MHLEGVETVFYSTDFAGQVSYWVQGTSSGSCWVGGADPTYYGDLGCTEVTFTETVVP